MTAPKLQRIARAVPNRPGPEGGLEYLFRKSRLRSRFIENLVSKVERGTYDSVEEADGNNGSKNLDAAAPMTKAYQRAARNAMAPFLKQISRKASHLPDVIVKNTYEDLHRMLMEGKGVVPPYKLVNILESMDIASKEWEHMRAEAEREKAAALTKMKPNPASDTPPNTAAASNPQESLATSMPSPEPPSSTPEETAAAAKPKAAVERAPATGPAALLGEQDTAREQAFIRNEVFRSSAPPSTTPKPAQKPFISKPATPQTYYMSRLLATQTPAISQPAATQTSEISKILAAQPHATSKSAATPEPPATKEPAADKENIARNQPTIPREASKPVDAQSTDFVADDLDAASPRRLF